ncbi:hypothetical protein FRB94_003764 [Tulasnella sp. JGI-2019a]|nr:hypothetical protein FRB93_012201 [Tulasnella sp. JGI-2019a]KAG9002616.1 hypothetical protein FRB94_003764 [Tulasnella sp. JGI-2019a]KAG9031553.1 hypothetical protein FRB95_002547 [Tulasnella sp. JGI-2019a]
MFATNVLLRTPVFRGPLIGGLFRSSRPAISNVRTMSNSTTSPSSGEATIRQKLTSRFQPTRLDVEDVSGGCGTFYAISIASSQFRGLSMVKQHKLVTEELKKEIEGIHGLQIKTSTDQ